MCFGGAVRGQLIITLASVLAAAPRPHCESDTHAVQVIRNVVPDTSEGNAEGGVIQMALSYDGAYLSYGYVTYEDSGILEVGEWVGI